MFLPQPSLEMSGLAQLLGAADHLKCTEVTGTILSVNASGPALG